MIKSHREIILAALVAVWMVQQVEGSYGNEVDGVNQNKRDWCRRVCFVNNTKYAPASPACPTTPVCPQPICPQPICPALPPIPKCPQPNCPTPTCPQPVCPALPPIPQCPKPECPTPVCNNASSCPKCTPCPQPPKTPPIRKGRPAGYEGYPCAPIGIYKYYANAISWVEANDTCIRDGAHLIIPNNKTEVDMLKNIMAKHKKTKLHVGFHDTQQEGYYVSVLGEPLDAVQRSMWKKGQPGGGRRQNCAVMHRNGAMHDWPCTSKFSFVCEVPY